MRCPGQSVQQPHLQDFLANRALGASILPQPQFRGTFRNNTPGEPLFTKRVENKPSGPDVLHPHNFWYSAEAAGFSTGLNIAVPLSL